MVFSSLILDRGSLHLILDYGEIASQPFLSAWIWVFSHLPIVYKLLFCSICSCRFSVSVEGGELLSWTRTLKEGINKFNTGQ